MLLWLLSVTISSTQSPGACRQNMTENGHKRHEHQTFLSPAVDTCKTDASRGDGRGLRPRRRHDCAPEVSAPHLELRVSPMTGGTIERRFSLARCRFILEDRARANRGEWTRARRCSTRSL